MDGSFCPGRKNPNESSQTASSALSQHPGATRRFQTSAVDPKAWVTLDARKPFPSQKAHLHRRGDLRYWADPGSSEVLCAKGAGRCGVDECEQRGGRTRERGIISHLTLRKIGLTVTGSAWWREGGCLSCSNRGPLPSSSELRAHPAPGEG